MRHESPLPPCWQVLEGRVHYIVQESATTFSCSCPKCGGEIHEDGSWPDRATLFADEHPTLFCRRCGLVAFPDSFGSEGYTRPDPAALEAWRQVAIHREEERKRSAERALAHLRSGRLWEQYNEQLDGWARGYWRRRGIPDAFQDWWQLGFCPERRFSVAGETWVTDTATIPLFGPEWECLNIKHRLINVPPDGGKYRYELVGQPQPLFRCTPDNPLEGHVIAVEGEIKAAVTFAALDDAKVGMVGLPGVSPGQDIITQLSQAERVTLVMDPGARTQAWKLSERIGRARCRVLMCPTKIDDAIVSEGLTPAEVRDALRHALPAA